MTKAVFMDRDGVINELPRSNALYGFIYKKEDCHILPGVAEALAHIKQKGYLRIVITNQPPVARGLASMEEIDDLHEFINQQTQDGIDAFYTCPHHPEMHPDVPEYAKKYRIPCDCRKPAPGLLFQAARELTIDLAQSFMAGDMITDIAAGAAAGCKTIMIESAANNRPPVISKEKVDFSSIKPDYYVKNLLEATNVIP